VTIGVALFDGAEELDWAGPWEVLAAWSKQWPDDGVRVLTLARDVGTITCAKGLQVVPEETWETAPPLDVLVYPGGRGTRRELADEAVLDWIRGLAGSGTVVASVCTGSLVLAAAGLLDGKPATTHWQSLELLPTLGREIEVRPDDRFVPSPRSAPLHPVRPRAARLSRTPSDCHSSGPSVYATAVFGRSSWPKRARGT
jgi:transcriptional regulator GlxA family with amidase domain